MARTSYLGDMLSTLLERPRRLLKGPGNGSLDRLCEALLEEQTEVSNLASAADILNCYAELDAEGKVAFFRHLNDGLDVDTDELLAAAKAYAADTSPQNYHRLARATEPKRYELLRRLNQPPGATAVLVRMRADLRAQMREDPDLARTDTDFKLMFRAWFNRGFLVMRQITWDSPASILEKIIAYEAVHEIETWDELRRRLHPGDRRCFAFFHPAMPDEPLIFVEVALAKGVPSSIQDVLTDKREVLDASAADSAVFYSISNCQKGLTGISFGNSLIKQVVRDLSMELPGISNFVTLSPIPKLCHWLDSCGISTKNGDPAVVRKLAAYYLTQVRNDAQEPFDPVARFHLQNGAQIRAIHADADLSANGLAQSFGAMVNYAYEFKAITENLRLLSAKKKVAASNPVRALARQGAQIQKNNRKAD